MSSVVISLSDAGGERRRLRAEARRDARLTIVPPATESTQELSIENLLMEVAAGDRTAFAEVYDRISNRVMGLVTRLLRDRAQSEEVTQEIFLEIWQSAGKFDLTRGSGISWVLTIAHRRAVDRIRASQKSHERDLKIGIRDMERDFDSVSELVEIRIENERVKRSMSRLTALQREAVILAYYGGYSHNEMASILGIPLGTVKTRLRDGMIRLRDELGVNS
ncbi:MAG: ECF RNA polymerase sigma factor SigK [Pseudolysinimonas sp.]|uniref:ECF RNA polymerase sigma factor SigK n=1 Tax=Pseudolysinimonas sp. TaxID=2680009 RepID=UPI003263AAFB